MRYILFWRIVVSLFMVFPIAGFAQEQNVSGGGNAFGSGGQVNYTIGQVGYTSSSGSNGSISEGVQQPYEFFTVDIFSDLEIDIKMNVYPNPTDNQIFLQIPDFVNHDISFTVSSVEGKLILSSQVQSESSIIDLQKFPAASYMISVVVDEFTAKTFKIIKN